MSSSQQIMENLPVEVRRMIYKKLGHKSLVQMRLINSTVKEDVDENVGFNVWIDTDGMTSETFTNLFNMKVHSLRLGNDSSRLDGNKSPTGWTFYPRFPSYIKTLELGKSWTGDDGEEDTDSSCFEDQLFYKVLRECPNIEYLSVNNTDFYGEYLEGSEAEDDLDQVERENIIRSMKSLRTLKVRFCLNLPEDLRPNTRTLQVFHTLLSNINSPVLTSLVLHVNVGSVSSSIGTYDPEPPEILRLFPNPWSTILRLISRHWETLRTLYIDFDWQVSGCSEDWSLVTLDEEFAKNVKSLKSLSNFSSLSITRSEYPEVEKILSNLLTQQTALEGFKSGPNDLTLEVLKQVVESNADSLRILDVEVKSNSTDSPNSLDMTIFSNCKQLETLKMKGCTRNLGIFNLGMVPAQLEELTLLGFSFVSGMSQLRSLSVQCQKLKKLGLDLTKLKNIGGLTSVMRNFVQFSEGIRSINFKIRQKLNDSDADEADGRAAWEEEIPSLETFFKCFSTHRSTPRLLALVSASQFRSGNDLSLVRLGPGQVRLANGGNVGDPTMTYHFRAWEITPEDREKALGEHDDDQ